MKLFLNVYRKFSLFMCIPFVALLFLFSGAQANVSLKNGNFFMGYTDVFYPGGFEPKVERVYNSKTPYQGIFGWGWGNEYEVYLTVSADGSVVVNEYGGGAENRFTPVGFKAEDLNAAIETIVQAAQKQGGLPGGDSLAAYRNKLKSNSTFRNDEWERLRKEAKLAPRVLPVNSQLVSTRFSFQYITKVANGYVRTFENGRTERFSEQGKLVRIQDKNNNFIDLAYDKFGRLQKITDNFNRKIFVTVNNKGLVEKIQGENGKEAVYRYNDLGELTYSKDVDGNTYSYKYSSDRRHNLVQIGYTDKTTLDIAYYGRDKFESVKSVKDRDGTLTEYTYDNPGGNKNRTLVGVKVKGSDGQEISNSSYEYFVKSKADGEEWNYRMVSILDGDKTETDYNEMGLPVKIVRGDDITSFAYDNKGRVIKKETPTEITKLAYDPKVGKVIRVDRLAKGVKKAADWSQFRYDSKGNLVFASNSEKKTVSLVYDNVGRIAAMIDQNKRRIEFKYNEHSKPVSITDPSLGTINVSYTNSGEIKKVDSTAGRKIALQVTSAFQNLLDIIRPAGVSLSF